MKSVTIAQQLALVILCASCSKESDVERDIGDSSNATDAKHPADAQRPDAATSDAGDTGTQCDITGTWHLEFSDEPDFLIGAIGSELTINVNSGAVVTDYFDDLADDCDCPPIRSTLDLALCEIVIAADNSHELADMECGSDTYELTLRFTKSPSGWEGDGHLVVYNGTGCNARDEGHASWTVDATRVN